MKKQNTKLNSGALVFLKRVFDLILSALLIALLWPLMLAIAIGVSFSGPVLIRRKVLGMKRKPFTMLKFRSIEDVGKRSKPKSEFLLWIRAYKLDMLPGLFNVLTGSMSFVGPCAEPRSFLVKYRNSMPGFMQRYKVRPGLISWARVMNKRGDVLIQEEEWIRYDLWYVANWTPWLDLSIIKKTFLDKKTYTEAAQERKERAAREEERIHTNSKNTVARRIWGQNEIRFAVLGYFGRPVLILFPVLILLYYLCYRMIPDFVGSMFTAFEVISAVLFVMAIVLALKKRTAAQIILFCNFAWMVITRMIHNDLTITPHGVCYFSAMFFAFYSCGVLVKNRQRRYLIYIVAVTTGAVLLLWAVLGIVTALTGHPVKGFELIRLQVERTPALMTFISFFGTHRNISSTYFVIMMGLVIYQYTRYRNMLWKIAVIVIVPVCYITVAMQHSRSNYMAASIVLTVALGKAAIDRTYARNRNLYLAVLGVTSVIGLFVFFSGFYYTNSFMELIANRFRSEYEQISVDSGTMTVSPEIQLSDPRSLQNDIQTLNRRTNIWKAAIPVVKEHPKILLIGRPEDLIMETINERIEWRKEPHMHNLFLQQLMVAGIPGMLLYLGLFVIIFKNIYLTMSGGKYGTTVSNWILCGILAGLFVYGMLEPLLSPKIPYTSLMYCLIAGCLDGETQKIRNKAPGGGRQHWKYSGI